MSGAFCKLGSLSRTICGNWPAGKVSNFGCFPEIFDKSMPGNNASAEISLSKLTPHTTSISGSFPSFVGILLAVIWPQSLHEHISSSCDVNTNFCVLEMCAAFSLVYQGVGTLPPLYHPATLARLLDIGSRDGFTNRVLQIQLCNSFHLLPSSWHMARLTPARRAWRGACRSGPAVRRCPCRGAGGTPSALPASGQRSGRA